MNLYKTCLASEYHLLFLYQKKKRIEPCKCFSAVEHHPTSLSNVSDITKLDFDEGAAHAIWHIHQAMCTCSAENPVGSAEGAKSCAKYSGLLTT